MVNRLKPGDRVRMVGPGSWTGTVSQIGWDGDGGQQLMVEVKWDSGGFGGPFVRDLVRIEEPAAAVRTTGPTP